MAASSSVLTRPRVAWKCSRTSRAMSRIDHGDRRRAGSVDAGEDERAERVAAVQRAVRAAADVVGAAPVEELVAGRRGEQHVARRRAVERRPHARERVGVGVAERKTPSSIARVERREVARARPSAPPRASRDLLARRERQRRRAVASTTADAVLAVHDEVDALDREQRARAAAAAARSRPSWTQDVDHRAALRRADRDLAVLGRRAARARSTSKSRSAPNRSTCASTSACEWSATTITACSSRNASGPPPACMTRSSWRSAAWIDVTCACGPVLVRVRVVVGQRQQQEVEEVVLDEVRADAARVLVADARHARAGCGTAVLRLA